MNDIEVMFAQRQIINDIDEQILDLLEQRILAAKIIGAVKRKNGKLIYAPEVEKEKIEKLSAVCEYPGLVEAIWPVIMCYTRTIE